MEKVLLVAPAILAPPLRHWYVSGAVPVADTEKEAAVPAVTVWFEGWVEIEGDEAAAVTVRTASAEVTLPAVLVTTTL